MGSLPYQCLVTSSKHTALFLKCVCAHLFVLSHTIASSFVIFCRYKPLDSAMTEMLSIDLFWICCCSHFYNAVLDEEPNHYYERPIRGYQSPTNNARMSASTGWGGTEEPI